LVDELLSNSAESNWLEFKRDNTDREIIGKLSSALSNGARIAGRDFGYLLWGIDDATQAILYGPRTFAQMTAEERIRACYQHAVLKFLSGERMKNSTLSIRFGIKEGNTAQTSKVLAQAQEQGLIKPADKAFPRAGYVPFWA
jgi:hypothetical protein